jgi:hypothetical protein
MNRIKPLAVAILAVSSLGAASLASADAVEDRIQELERQLQELKSQVSSQQQEIAANKTEVMAEIDQARPMAKGTKFTYGGFIQLDAITSDYSEGKPANLIEDFYVPSLVPVEPASGNADSYTSTNFTAKTSRFFFTTATDTEAGLISTRIELDFMLSNQGDERISNSWSSRLRQAFVNWEYEKGSSVLAGQSWTTFFNVAALPDLLDFVGPTGTIFVRQPQIRWTVGGLQLAAENPATRLNDADGSTVYENGQEMPDLVARYNGTAGKLAWSAAVLGRQLRYDSRSDGGATEVGSDDQYGYGVSLAGKWMFGEDDLRFMLNVGDALGRYMGLNAFNDGYINANGDIKTVDSWGAFLAYQHYWSPRWRSTLSISMAEADNPDTSDFAGAQTLAKEYKSMHANLNWLPAPKLSIGGELILASKELEDGRDGDLSRLQFAVKYAF